MYARVRVLVRVRVRVLVSVRVPMLHYFVCFVDKKAFPLRRCASHFVHLALNRPEPIKWIDTILDPHFKITVRAF